MSIANLGSGAADLDALAAAARGPLGGVQPPAGLPDVTLLTRLANEFFAALPGQSAADVRRTLAAGIWRFPSRGGRHVGAACRGSSHVSATDVGSSGGVRNTGNRVAVR